MKTVRLMCGDEGGSHERKLVDVETGETLHGVEKVGVPMFGAYDVVKVEAVIGMAQINVEGVPTIMVAHPMTGEMKPIASITFADGTEFKAG